MEFDAAKKGKKIGKFTGFIVMYLIFTTILFFILRLTKNLPSDWNYFYVANITLFIVLLGTLIRWMLK